MVMLLFVYRSVVTMVPGARHGVHRAVRGPRGRRRSSANSGIIGLSTYSTNMLTLLAIAAGTDYAIFMLGRYHEARNVGEDREAAFYTMYHGTTARHLGSGLTIAGAVVLPELHPAAVFPESGCPAAIGVLVALVAALTLAPAVLIIGRHVRSARAQAQAMRTRGWRRIGTAIVRWPGPILVGDHRHCADRSARAARLQDQLRRPPLPPATTLRPMSATRPPNGTSPRRGSIPSC